MGSFDIEPPVQCDDEYWEIDENSYVTFNQPPGKPSYITAFIAHLKLTEILAFAMRTLYSTKKTWITSLFADGESEQRLVAEVDSAMNQWKDWLPDHRTHVIYNIRCGIEITQLNGTRTVKTE